MIRRRFHPRETPLDTARRVRDEHITDCPACVGGLDCPTADDLDARLTREAEADVPWPATRTT